MRFGNPSSMGGELFRKKISFEVGEGSRFCFCVDDWSGLGPLFLSFSKLFSLVVNKWTSAKNCYMGEGRFGSWDLYLGGSCVNLRSLSLGL